MDQSDVPLEVGDMVTYNNHVSAFGVSGQVVERVGDEFLRVKWSDLSEPRTHRCHSLKRVVTADYWKLAI